MPEQTILKCTMPKTKARCETCNGNFGLIRHRHASKQFCSKQCLARHLAKTKQQASSFKAWISRKIAVDWNALHFPMPGKPGGRIALELTRDQVKAAPEYQKGKPVAVLGAQGKLEPLPE